MYRTFLTAAIVVALSLTGCGGKKDSNSNSNGGAPSSLPAEQQAQLGIKVDMGSFLNSPMGGQAVDMAGPEMPAFIKSATKLDVYVNLTAEMQTDPSGVNFHARMQFSDAESAKAAFEEFKKEAPSVAKDEDIGGKTYMVVEAGDAPTVCAIQEDTTLVICSRAYAEDGSGNYATEGLRSIMNGLDDDMLQVGFDMAAAKGMVQKMTAPMANDKMAKPIVDALMSVTGVKITAGMGDTMFMLGFDGENEEATKNIQQQLQKGLGLLAFGAGAITPDESKAPASAEMFGHIMDCLTPQVEGTTVKVVITKPENYAELEKKIVEEVKSGAAMPPMAFGGGPGKSASKFDEKEDFKKDELKK